VWSPSRRLLAHLEFNACGWICIRELPWQQGHFRQKAVLVLFLVLLLRAGQIENVHCGLVGRDRKRGARGRESEGEDGCLVDAAAELSELCARGEGPEADDCALLAGCSDHGAVSAERDGAQGCLVGGYDADVSGLETEELDLADGPAREGYSVGAQLAQPVWIICRLVVGESFWRCVHLVYAHRVELHHDEVRPGYAHTLDRCPELQGRGDSLGVVVPYLDLVDNVSLFDYHPVVVIVVGRTDLVLWELGLLASSD